MNLSPTFSLFAVQKPAQPVVNEQNVWDLYFRIAVFTPHGASGPLSVQRMPSNPSIPYVRQNAVGTSCAHPTHIRSTLPAISSPQTGISMQIVSAKQTTCNRQQTQNFATSATSIGIGVIAYKFAGCALHHVRLAECLDEVGPFVAPVRTEHSRQRRLRVVYRGVLVLAAVTEQGVPELASPCRWTVFRGVASVEGDHEAPVVDDLEGQECAVAQVLFFDEARPPAAYARRGYSPLHIGEPPKTHWPLLQRADGGQEGAILFRRPPCLRSEGGRDLLHFSEPQARRETNS